MFAKGKRPDRDAIAVFAARQQLVTLSHVLQSGDTEHAGTGWHGQQIWTELLREGLTFDLSGLAPGPAVAFPIIEHRFDLAETPSSERFDALAIAPGPHLASGRRSMPVIRGMLALACDLIRHFDDLAAVGWGPSRSAIGRRFFESVASAWLDGGPFPALGLTAFSETPDGAVQSEGLKFWTGQELRIEPPLSADKVAATRLGIRLVNQLVLAGGLETDEWIIAPDGSRLVLRPSGDRDLISVWRE